MFIKWLHAVVAGPWRLFFFYMTKKRITVNVGKNEIGEKLLTVDLLARASMKNAARCDK